MCRRSGRTPGNAGITSRELPSVEVLASMQHIEGRARALRDAGMPGTWQELKARALLDRRAREPVTLGGILELLGITGLTPVIRGPCQHTGAEDRYRPSRRLAHRVKARNTTSTAPGCGRRAATCDLDHTDPHH